MLIWYIRRLVSTVSQSYGINSQSAYSAVKSLAFIWECRHISPICKCSQNSSKFSNFSFSHLCQQAVISTWITRHGDLSTWSPSWIICTTHTNSTALNNNMTSCCKHKPLSLNEPLVSCGCSWDCNCTRNVRFLMYVITTEGKQEDLETYDE